MQIIVSGARLAAEVEKWLTERLEEKQEAIVTGVPVHVYRERCAEVRAYRNVLAELPNMIKRAKD